VDNGDLLLAWSGTPGTSFGAHIWGGEASVLNQHIFKVGLSEKELDKLFAVRVINFRLSILIDAAHGGVGLRHVKKGEVESLPIPLPPLQEQKRIAAILNEQLAAVENAKKAAEERLEAARALQAAYLREVFEGEEAKKWPFQQFGQFITDARNGFGRRPKGYEQGPVVLRIADVSSGYVDLSNPRRGHMTDREFNTYALTPGDLLFIRVNGSTNYVGKCIHVTEADERLAYNDHLIRVKVRGSLEPAFLAWFLNSELIRRHMIERASTSAGQLTINQAAITDIKVPVIERSEQKRIALELDDKIAGVGLVEQSIQQEMETIAAMPAALLRKAFSGEL